MQPPSIRGLPRAGISQSSFVQDSHAAGAGSEKAKTTDTRGRAGGEVEAIGRDVTQFKAGDQVLAFRGMRFGTYAQYICMREDALLLLKPDHVTYDDAAAVSFGGTTALHFLRKGNIRQGHKVLIYGASGAVGTLAVQLAKQHYGAEVTGVCSAVNMGLVRSLGADRVLDYTKRTLRRPEIDTTSFWTRSVNCQNPNASICSPRAGAM